ncbi:Crp/Fnr family transcriptional regulator [Hominifimenecus sp. rT4P-3]|uniref:Crp/Fnr family transcriptional regulator n=1 Tax=Hominifimenecus sp. rT4P-3 TaxID=3242979 RepID=UPI003DA3127A
MNFDFISKTALFRGCSEEDVQKMAKHLDFKTVCYKKGTTIYEEGNITTNIGLVLSGSVQIGHDDFWGNQSILSIVKAGGVFAEAYACIPEEPLMIRVAANENCEILFINVPKLFLPCTACGVQNRLIQNLLTISAQKNLQLSKRSLHTSPKTIRGRLLSYFSQLISEQGSSKIVIPFDRQQLADYLNLDRSALSKELGKMKQDGLIDYRKNVFEIKKANI